MVIHDGGGGGYGVVDYSWKRESRPSYRSTRDSGLGMKGVENRMKRTGELIS